MKIEPMEPSALEVRHTAPDMSVATFRSVVLVVVHRAVDAEALRASVLANREVFATHGKVASLTLVRAGIGLPSAEARKAAADAMAEVESTTTCAAQVLLGDGFWASAQRSALLAIELIRPDETPRRTFRSLREAVVFIADKLGEPQEFIDELERIAGSVYDRELPEQLRATP